MKLTKWEIAFGLLTLLAGCSNLYFIYEWHQQERRADAFMWAANEHVWKAKKVRIKRDVALLRLAADELTGKGQGRAAK